MGWEESTVLEGLMNVWGISTPHLRCFCAIKRTSQCYGEEKLKFSFSAAFRPKEVKISSYGWNRMPQMYKQ